jgi:hypothetical protein
MSNYFGLEPVYQSHPTQSFTSDGVTTSFPLTVNPGSPSSIIVNQDGVIQRPGLDYTLSAGNLVFAIAPPVAEIGTTNNIYVVYLGVNVSVGTPGANTVGASQIIDASITITELAPALIASNTDAQAQASLLTLLTPGTLATAFQGTNQSLLANGYQKLPGGLILQWGSQVVTGVNTLNTFSYPLTFPTGVHMIIGSSSTLSAYGMGFGLSTSQFNLASSVSGATVSWIAIGK